MGGLTTTQAAGGKVRGGWYAFTKGAPEVLSDLLAVKPNYYDAVSKYHMCRGKRVLALAHRVFEKGEMTATNLRGWSRAKVEERLTFIGFLVFDCNLKADSKSVSQKSFSRCVANYYLT